MTCQKKYLDMDAAYQMKYSIPDSNSTLVLTFAGIGLQSIADENWGLDNFQVTLSAGADLMPRKIYLPVVWHK